MKSTKDTEEMNIGRESLNFAEKVLEHNIFFQFLHIEHPEAWIVFGL